MRSTRMHSCGTRSGMRVQRLSSCSFSSWFSQGCSTVSEIRRCITSEHRPRASFAYPRVGCVVFSCAPDDVPVAIRSEEHTSELQSRGHLVCRLLLEKKNDREDV